ncbi:MAG: glycosyltransferase family 4 protein [Anaerolineales bacterium]
MKILMIAPQPFFEPRGTPISVRQRVTGLLKLGHQVDLATYHIGEDIELPNFNILRTPKIWGIHTLKVGPSWQKIPLDILLFFKSFKLLLGGKYEVIHTHEEAGFFTVFLARLFKVPHLYDMHSSLPNQLVNFKFGANRFMIAIFEFLERWVINTCNAMITIGPDLEKYVRKINPAVPMQMIENLPLNIGQDDGEVPSHIREKFSSQNGLSLLYTGTFERYQGVELLIDSFGMVVKKHPGSVLILVGGKPDQIRECQELVSRQNLDQSVIFTGIVPLEDANAYIRMADILVSPRIEGTSVPLKIYTYLHAGKPILATNIPAHSLVLSQENACLVDPTAEAMADGLNHLIEDHELRTKISLSSKKLAEEKYSQSQYLSKLESIYNVFQSEDHSGSRVSNLPEKG